MEAINYNLFNYCYITLIHIFLLPPDTPQLDHNHNRKWHYHHHHYCHHQAHCLNLNCEYEWGMRT